MRVVLVRLNAINNMALGTNFWPAILLRLAECPLSSVMHALV